MVTIVTMVAILGIALPTAAQAPQGLPGPIAPPHFLPTEDRAWAAGGELHPGAHGWALEPGSRDLGIK